MLASLTARIEIWKQALEAWWSAPIWGIGWGELPYWMYSHGTSYGVDRNAHNLLVHFLAETGLVGMCLMVFALVKCIPTKFVHIHIPLYGIVLIQLVHSQIEFPLFYMQFLVPFCLILGIIRNEQA